MLFTNIMQIKRVYIVNFKYLLLVSAVFLVLYFGGRGISGLAVFNPVINETIDVNQDFRANDYYEAFLGKPTQISALKIDGSFAGEGNFRVYLETGNKSLLVYEKQESKKPNLMTGLAIADTSESTSENTGTNKENNHEEQSATQEETSTETATQEEATTPPEESEQQQTSTEEAAVQEETAAQESTGEETTAGEQLLTEETASKEKSAEEQELQEQAGAGAPTQEESLSQEETPPQSAEQEQSNEETAPIEGPEENTLGEDTETTSQNNTETSENEEISKDNETGSTENEENTINNPPEQSKTNSTEITSQETSNQNKTENKETVNESTETNATEPEETLEQNKTEENSTELPENASQTENTENLTNKTTAENNATGKTNVTNTNMNNTNETAKNQSSSNEGTANSGYINTTKTNITEINTTKNESIKELSESFSKECIESCNMNIKTDSIRLRIEIEGNITLHLSKIEYYIPANELQKEPILIKQIPDIEVRDDRTTKINLNEYFDGMSLKFGVDSPDVLSVRIANGTAYIKPRKPFEKKRITFYAANKYGSAESNDVIVKYIDIQKEMILQTLYKMYPSMKVIQVVKNNNLYSFVLELNETTLRITGIKNVTDIRNITTGNLEEPITI